MSAHPAASDAAPDGADVVLEPFAPADVEAVLRLAQRSLAMPEEQLGTPLWASRDELVAELCDWEVAAAETVAVAREAGEVRGFVGVECYPGTGLCLLHGPVVEPAARGIGVGSALLAWALERARELGMHEVWSAAGRENQRADRMLRTLGFERGEVNAIYRLERPRHRPLEDERHVALREAGADDLELALDLVGACRPAAPVGRDELERLLADPEVHVYLAGADGNEPFGALAIDEQQRWIPLLGVHESVRGRGFAGAMLSKALGAFWEEHPEVRLGLTVRLDNLAAINLYRRQGFEPALVLARYSLAL